MATVPPIITYIGTSCHLKLETNHHLVSPESHWYVVGSHCCILRRPLPWDHCHRPQRCLGQCHRACWGCLHPSYTGARSCPGPAIHAQHTEEILFVSVCSAGKAEQGDFGVSTTSVFNLSDLSDLSASIQPRLWHRKFGCPTPQPCLRDDGNALQLQTCNRHNTVTTPFHDPRYPRSSKALHMPLQIELRPLVELHSAFRCTFRAANSEMVS